MSFRLRALCALVLFVFTSLASAADFDVTFSFDAKQLTDKPSTVHVAGSFNGWNPQGLAMTNNNDVWTATIKLAEGDYQYKFVLNAADEGKRKWIQDPTADPELNSDDGNGGQNSGMTVGPGAKKFPPAKTNDVNGDAIVFHADDASDLQVVDAEHLRVRLRTLHDDVETVSVRTNGGAFRLQKLAAERGMDLWGGLIPNASFTIFLTDGPSYAEVGSDRSMVVTAANAGWVEPISPKPFSVHSVSSVANTPDWASDAVWYQIFPERFRNGDPSNDPGDIGYDRLVPWNGNWWMSQPGESEGFDNFYKGDGNVWNRRYGGDLQGITEKLPYLRELGINAIYLNPVFEAESMHKYDTADYRHIDDNFGAKDPVVERSGTGYQPVPPAPTTQADHGLAAHATTKTYRAPREHLYTLGGTVMPDDYVETDDPATWRWTKSDLIFLQFIKDAHEQGFHVILDGVFNHVGRAHPFFQDVLEKGKNSKYADWFEITDWGDPANWHKLDDPYQVHGKPGGIQWKAWDSNNGWLPVLKKDQAHGLAVGPYNHIMGITRRWLDPDGNPQTRDGIDGWRLDVPGDIPHPFWIDWRKTVKAANPEGYITGEIWTPAQPWINAGDQFDAVMNYVFADACQQFFANVAKAITPTQMNDRLVKMEFMYPLQNAMVMQNLFDSHDTDRAPSWFVNPDRPYDGQNRPQDNAANNPYSERKPTAEEWKRYQQMAQFQMTFLGAPMIYYGDEAGMWGPDDPSNRQPFPWDDKAPYEQEGVGFNRDQFALYQRAIAARNALPALRQGFYAPVQIDDKKGVLAFSRELGGQVVYGVVNRSVEENTVELTVPDGVYVNYLDPAQVDVKMPQIAIATARPVANVIANAGVKAEGGKLKLKLAPYGVAILTQATKNN
ncbi:MAG: alpha-amylase family glycosyl hydrolase [Tepidisphaeraceae bacterium]